MIACEQALYLRMGRRLGGKREEREEGFRVRERREATTPPRSILGHFTLSQFILALPAGAWDMNEPQRKGVGLGGKKLVAKIKSGNGLLIK